MADDVVTGGQGVAEGLGRGVPVDRVADGGEGVLRCMQGIALQLDPFLDVERTDGAILDGLIGDASVGADDRELELDQVCPASVPDANVVALLFLDVDSSVAHLVLP